MPTSANPAPRGRALLRRAERLWVEILKKQRHAYYVLLTAATEMWVLI